MTNPQTTAVVTKQRAIVNNLNQIDLQVSHLYYRRAEVLINAAVYSILFPTVAWVQGQLRESMMHHKRHRDFEIYDEVRIRTVVRFKTSEMSGDEYRTSAVVELLFKSQVVKSKQYRNVAAAAQCLGALMLDHDAIPQALLAQEKTACDQPGCPEEATQQFSLNKLYSQQGEELVQEADHYRQFCVGHARRGDCGLEDADANYTRIEDA